MNKSDIGKQPLAVLKSNHRKPNLKTGDNRWKWMAAAAAATAGGVAQSQAGLVTISLSNNFISATGGNHLNADLTGDGQSDLTIAYAVNYRRIHTSSGHTLTGFTRSYAGVDLNGVHAAAFFSHDYGYGSAKLGSQSQHFGARSVTSGIHPYASVTGSVPISFKDLHINGGKLTTGSLQVTVFAGFNELNNGAKVQLDSFTFTTPDQGSSLALLAMGAGGVLALRRWRAAQKTS
jgi:hypothetical protein